MIFPPKPYLSLIYPHHKCHCTYLIVQAPDVTIISPSTPLLLSSIPSLHSSHGFRKVSHILSFTCLKPFVFSKFQLSLNSFPDLYTPAFLSGHYLLLKLCLLAWCSNCLWTSFLSTPSSFLGHRCQFSYLAKNTSPLIFA